jgi:sugar diacid utilization regulator
MNDMTASTSMSHHEAAASIVAAARTSLPDLVERVAHRIRTEIPCYAAAELFCHPNTVRYRLRRIEAGTGRVLANPGDVAELVTAVRAWREVPHS